MGEKEGRKKEEALLPSLWLPPFLSDFERGPFPQKMCFGGLLEGLLGGLLGVFGATGFQGSSIWGLRVCQKPERPPF